MQPIHQMLSLRQAMIAAYKLNNFGHALSFAQRLLELSPPEEMAAKVPMAPPSHPPPHVSASFPPSPSPPLDSRQRRSDARNHKFVCPRIFIHNTAAWAGWVAGFGCVGLMGADAQDCAVLPAEQPQRARAGLRLAQPLRRVLRLHEANLHGRLASPFFFRCGGWWRCTGKNATRSSSHGQYPRFASSLPVASDGAGGG